MSETKSVIKGVVRGKTIELQVDAGLPDGQEVNVTIQPVSDPDDLLQRNGSGGIRCEDLFCAKN